VEKTETTRKSLPLYGAPYRSGLHGGRLATLENRLKGINEVVAPHGCRIVVIVVHRAWSQRVPTSSTTST
jgi:hypothetical protein